jgi:hypothetical protein
MLMYSCSVLLINVLGLATCTRPSSTGTTALRVLVVLLVVVAVLRTTATYYSQPADTRLRTTASQLTPGVVATMLLRWCQRTAT